MGKNDLTSLSEKAGLNAGQSSIGSGGNRSSRIIYPAIVRDVDDKSGQNRIRAEIVYFDENGEIKGGKDNNTPLDKLPLCVPLLPEFFHARPEVGECVYLLIENPSDMSSPRFWIGPVRSSQTKMNFESFQQAQGMFNRSSFKQGEIQNKVSVEANAKIQSIIPQQPEISVQGKKDADITLKNREVLIRAGKFIKNTLDINSDHPCSIQLKQIDERDDTGVFTSAINNRSFRPFSQMNIVATNINLISTEGENRNPDSITVETTTNFQNLERFGGITKELHPLMFGDEMIKLIKLMVNFMLTHIHTPQEVAVAPLEDIDRLSEYRSDEKLQELVSKNVRTN